jgi:hypothetical protein
VSDLNFVISLFVNENIILAVLIYKRPFGHKIVLFKLGLADFKSEKKQG